MKVLLVSNKHHQLWKRFCFKKGIKMHIATEVIIDLAIMSKKQISRRDKK